MPALPPDAEASEKLLSKRVRFPTALWAEIERRVPIGERAAFLRRAIERELMALSQTRASQPIWDRIAELGDAIPPEERANLPADMSEHLDHYLYGPTSSTASRTASR